MSDSVVTREAETVRRKWVLVAETPAAHLPHFDINSYPIPFFSLSDTLNTLR